MVIDGFDESDNGLLLPFVLVLNDLWRFLVVSWGIAYRDCIIFFRESICF